MTQAGNSPEGRRTDGEAVVTCCGVTPAMNLTVERSRTGAEDLADLPEHGLAERILRVHEERMRRIHRETQLTQQFSAGFPHVPVARAAAQATDVHDLNGLRALGTSLAQG